ncbi:MULTISPECIES: homoserine kinase [Shewanella]|uniref:homoserine kinase n=1 Tax=Shewanella TaxID=22 RepID=UPI000C37BEF8|nr:MULTISPECIES: homoserine kinase [Shewanella]NCQ44615.1 homoserine kinase [Shewanella frigidimarina]NCO72278.1 homoserine kinase [Shewanella vesiculosa]NCP35958.1 homoserine kinase [Shewanella vesiculosa]NCP68655.1 homoserine kinase [Shewanella vesiculosa]NCP73622.1 homoserine kinase [Shewanella vesiculosa]
MKQTLKVSQDTLTVYAPASMGNVGVGFDLLGAALAPIDGSLLGDRVIISSAVSGISYSQVGEWAHKLPADGKDNIVYQCAEFFLDKLQRHDGVTICLEKNLPVGSGLGSSASSVVAALYALNEHFGLPFDQQALLALMGEFEGKISGSVHYDNVAPCYLGGMQLMLNSDKQACATIPSFDNWYWVVAYPGISLSTAKMRALLPLQYDKSVAIDFGRYLSAFVHASYQQDAVLAIEMLKDVLAEPYRAAAIPGYTDARAALTDLGMLTTGISGSGPTLFSVTDDLATAEKAKVWLMEHYISEPGGFAHICKLDQLGTRCV